MSARTALVIMARYPEVGAVKTRLAAVIGAPRAAELYRAFLLDLDARFHAGRRRLVWAFSPPESAFAAVIASGARCVPQVGDGLAQRMNHCFRALCTEGFERVIMIGSDVPHVRDEWLDEAEERLDGSDVVLGPSEDGGYYLVALRRPHDLFTGITMSTPRVLRDTLRKAEAARLRVHLLPKSFDLDTAADLVRLRECLQDAAIASRLPMTGALLSEWGVAAGSE